MALWVRTDASSWDDYARTRTRVQAEPIKVLLLGISRTVSAAMRPASRILNRSPAIASDLLDIDAWTDVLNARFFGRGPMGKMETDEWEEMLGCCELSYAHNRSLSQELERCSGSPGPTSPNSPTKTHRNHNRDVIAKLGRNKPFVVSACLDARFLRRLRPFFPIVWLTFFGDFPAAASIKGFHGAGLGADVQLLEHKVGDGWERVCVLLDAREEEDDEAEKAPTHEKALLDDADSFAFGERIHRLTYGVFQGLGGTVVMQIALVGSPSAPVGVSIFFAHRNL
ncbi:hypothetical protein C8F01DRAFT_1374317 [Mycena amicta]|nr:hypothetical protein C8F01DRAFT_1374317 [Mycena amicta]